MLVPVPERVPRVGNRLTRWIGRSILILLGWRVDGTLPNQPKLVLAAAPHTSNWDFILAMAVAMALGVKLSYLMKKEAFVWPLKYIFLALGGVPIDRKASEGVVSQLNTWFEENEKAWLAITPEGTRAHAGVWKTGFLRVIERAKVPLLIVAWDYPSKTVHIDKLWPVSGQHVDDLEAIQRHFREHYTGRHPSRQ